MRGRVAWSFSCLRLTPAPAAPADSSSAGAAGAISIFPAVTGDTPGGRVQPHPGNIQATHTHAEAGGVDSGPATGTYPRRKPMELPTVDDAVAPFKCKPNHYLHVNTGLAGALIGVEQRTGEGNQILERIAIALETIAKEGKK